MSLPNNAKVWLTGEANPSACRAGIDTKADAMARLEGAPSRNRPPQMTANSTALAVGLRGRAIRE